MKTLEENAIKLNKMQKVQLVKNGSVNNNIKLSQMEMN